MAKSHAAAISNRPSRPSAQREFPRKNKNRGVQVVKLHVPFLFSLRRLWYQTQPCRAGSSRANRAAASRRKEKGMEEWSGALADAPFFLVQRG